VPKTVKELANKIWKIRDSIQELEDVKDEIVKFLKIDMWISDIKECYFSIVAAWEMLRAVSEGKEEFADSCKSYLSGAKGCSGQASSEMKALKEQRVDELNQSFVKTFKKCHELISTELKKLIPEPETKEPTKRVVKISETEYELLCQVCGKVCVNFRIGTTRFVKEESLVFSGITHQTTIKKKYAEKIFNFLSEDKIAELHSLVHKRNILEDGIDAYCPECDKIYCWIHYNAEEEWDEGFYDYTYGTCPEGHRRIIND